MLKHAFSSKDVSERREEAILRDYGMRWSIMNVLPGWLPASQTVLDFMHNMFLGTCLICDHGSLILTTMRQASYLTSLQRFYSSLTCFQESAVAHLQNNALKMLSTQSHGLHMSHACPKM